jgi:uncharacterized protein
MKYLNRLAEKHFLQLSNFFPVVLVTGPRQVGKTTMLNYLSKNENRTYVTLDDLDARNLAINDPKLFFQKYKTPILIDEVQFAPNLFSYIKVVVDKNKQPGEFWLTGSQSYSIMKNINESLAGRIGIMSMYSFTYQEVIQTKNDIPTNFSLENLLKLKSSYPTLTINEVFKYIFIGGMPKLINANEEIRKTYFNSYINSYLMRDVVELGKITDLVKFNNFLVACASQVGNVVNYANLSNASNISQPTAKEWLEVLQGMGIVYLIQPYYNNALKRLTKTPKLYFYDTGLCSYLAKIPSNESLQVSSMAGAYFENYIMNQFVIKYQLLPQAPDIYFYRDIDKNEVDILISSFEGIAPIEIKLSANPNKRDIGKFSVLNKLDRPIIDGGIICLIDNIYPVDEKNCLIPAGIL